MTLTEAAMILRLMPPSTERLIVIAELGTLLRVLTLSSLLSPGLRRMTCGELENYKKYFAMAQRPLLMLDICDLISVFVSAAFHS